jgi:hypothetical protein
MVTGPFPNAAPAGITARVRVPVSFAGAPSPPDDTFDYPRAFAMHRRKAQLTLSKKGYIERPIERRARMTVKCALAAGALSKPLQCEVCQRQMPLHGHHENYARPRWVAWLCARCRGAGVISLAFDSNRGTDRAHGNFVCAYRPLFSPSTFAVLKTAGPISPCGCPGGGRRTCWPDRLPPPADSRLEPGKVLYPGLRRPFLGPDGPTWGRMLWEAGLTTTSRSISRCAG